MNVYKTKSGVQIGLLYQPRPPQMSRDMELLQSALLAGTPCPTPANPLKRIVNTLYRWL